MTVTVMLVPNPLFAVAEYGTSFKMCIVALLLALTVMMLTYDHLRAKSQSRRPVISSQLNRAARTDELTTPDSTADKHLKSLRDGRTDRCRAHVSSVHRITTSQLP